MLSRSFDNSLNNHIKILFVILSCGFFFLSCHDESSNPSFSVTNHPSIPDSNLQKCINDAKNALTDPSLSLTSLHCPDANIEDLTGIETLPTLEVVDFSNNKIKNITPVFDLLSQTISYDNSGRPSTKPVLTTVNLSNNHISDANKILTFSPSINIDLSNNPLRNLPYPKNIHAIPKNSENILRWQAIPQALSYNIYFKENNQTETTHKVITQWRDTRYVHTALTNDITYFYQVSANFTAGESHLSPSVSATPAIANTTPLQPENVTLVAIAADQIMIDWNEAPHATSYTLRSAIKGHFPDITNILPPFQHSELSPGTTYWYQLVSVNELGESLVTKEYSATTLQQTDIQPSNIIEFSAIAEDNQVTLNWEKLTVPQSLYFSLEPYNDITTIKQSATLLTQDNPPWSHKELTNNVSYYYYLVTGTSGDSVTFQRQTAKPNRLLSSLSFDDNNLSQCINDSGYHTVAELQTLNCANYNIHSLDGIASLSALQELILEHNAINDMQPINSLTNLRKLSLYDNQLSNITGINELNQLEQLELRSNQIDDLSPLTTLDHLVTLGVSDNKLVNLSPLANLKNLESLDISNNSINNIDPLAQLHKLRRLDISQNRITEVTALAGLNKLVYLDLSHNTITDFTTLQNLTQLSFSNITSNTNATPVFTIGGTVTGLSGSGLILQLDNSNQLPITRNGHFNFPGTFTSGSPYHVTISKQPQQPAQQCIISNESGIIENADIDSIDITCETLSYHVDVSVSGLTGHGFELQLGEQKILISNDGPYRFPAPVLDGTNIQLNINQQPKQPLQICTISEGVTRIQSADVKFSINCITEQFQLSGNITGLQGKGLLLQNNGANDLTIDQDGNFAFPGSFDDRSPFQISIKKSPSSPSQTCKIEGGNGLIDGNPVTSINISCEINRFSVGGSITGLLGKGLVLQNNGSDELNIDNDGSFRFQIPILDMNSYHVTVKQNPNEPSQTCTVSAESGNLQGADVSSIVVNCDPNKFTIGGTVQGLQGQGLILQNQGTNDLEIFAEGNFTFANPMTDQDSYAISLLQNPTNPVQTCVISQNQNGQTQGRNVTEIVVSCTTEKFTIGGQISGLLGDGLIITNNNQDNLIIDKDGEFQFTTAIFDHDNYAVSVLKNPVNPVQTCTVSPNGIGQLNGSHLRDIEITCATEKFKVGGRVIGLTGQGLVLTNNEDDHLTLDTDGEFQFNIPIIDGGSYQVSVTGQPSQPNQTCIVSGGDGVIAGNAAKAVVINCDTNSYTVGGSLNGLLGNGLELQLNGESQLTINRGSHFTFTPAIPDASEYQITILTQPNNPNQTCTINNGIGTIQGENIATAEVNCQTNTYSIGGTISGLSGSGLVLQNNGGDNLSIENDGRFTFANKIEDGNLYQVTIQQQPSQLSQTCSITNDNASGTVQGTDIAHIEIHCQTNSYSVGGSVTGLAGSGLILTSSTGDTLNINNNGDFIFDTKLIDGSHYLVSVSQQPNALSQTCTATNGEADIQGANINNIAINCQTNTFAIGGTITGLTGSGLILQNNATDDLSLSADGEFTFNTRLLDGSDYSISVKNQPIEPKQTCRASHGTGRIEGLDITSINLICEDNNFISNVQFTPTYPITLSRNDRVIVKFEYETVHADGVFIESKPYAAGSILPGRSFEASPLYAVGTGQRETSFTVTSDVEKIDQIRMEMRAKNTNELLREVILPVNYTIIPLNSEHNITNVTFSIESPNISESPTILSYDTPITVSYDYSTKDANGIEIWVEPFSRSNPSPRWERNSPQIKLPAGNGNGSTTFTIKSGATEVHVDEISLRMFSITPRNLELVNITEPANFLFQQIQPLNSVTNNFISNIRLSPVSPRHMTNNESIHIDFDYDTMVPEGILVIVQPISEEIATLASHNCQTEAYPVGTGSGNCFITINPARDMTLNALQLTMTTTDQRVILYETSIPINYIYGQTPTTNSPATKRPVIRTKTQANNNLSLLNIGGDSFSVYPANNAYNVSPNTMIAIKPNTLTDVTSLTPTDITLSNHKGSIQGQLAIKENAITFTPSQLLTPASHYTVTIHTSNDNTSSSFEWNFTTALLPSAQYTVAQNTRSPDLPQTTELLLIAHEKEAVLEFSLSAVPNKLSYASINFTLTTSASEQPTLFSLYSFDITQNTRNKASLLSSFSTPIISSQHISYSFPITQLLNKAQAQGAKTIGFRFAIVEGESDFLIENSEPNKMPSIMPYIWYLP